MGLVVQTNTQGINSNNVLAKSKKKLQKSMEKLASGCCINKAGDDASGLSISEKMRNQITALDTYECNTEDGANLVQTAEGAMSEISEMLQRGGELAMKATNGLLGDEERHTLQYEVDEILDEIDRIAVTTNFNGIKLFRFSASVSAPSSSYAPGVIGTLPAWCQMDSQSAASETLGNSITRPDPTDPTKNITLAATFLDFSSFTPADIANSVGTGFHTTCCTCNKCISIEFTNDQTSTVVQSGNHQIYKVTLNGANTADDIYDRIIALTGQRPNSHYTEFEKDNGKLVIHENRDGQQPDVSRYRGVMKPGIAVDPASQPAQTGIDYDLMINSGETDSGKIYIKLPRVSTTLLGVKNASVATENSAHASISSFRSALTKLSDERGRMGAYQNRMEHAERTITNTSENITAARSRIADTDMAKEMMTYTSTNVLSQATQSMLAQSNARTSDILSLLQG